MLDINFARIVIMVALIHLTFTTFLLVPQSSKQSNDLILANRAREELLVLEKSLAKAYIKKNNDFYESILTDSFVLMGLNKNVLQKKTFISKLADKNINYKVYLKRNVVINFYSGDVSFQSIYGETALVIYQLTAKGNSYGKTFNDTTCVRHVWSRLNNRWLLTSEQHLEKCK